MRRRLFNTMAGVGLISLALTSSQCATYNKLIGKTEVPSAPVSEVAESPFRVAPIVSGEGIEEAYQRGVLAMEEGNYPEAIEAFLSVFSRDPSYEGVRKKLIQAYRLSQRREAEARPKEEVVDYTISLGDVLAISVWQWPDLDMPNVIVRPDGKISFPLIGDLPAEGLTLTELDQVLTEKLTEFVKNPEVSVAVTQFGGRKVIVLGEVGNQGVYAPTGRTSVLEVIALAGGFRPRAVSSSVILIRQQPDRNLFYRLDLRTALKRGDTRENIEIQSDDIIFVPSRFVSHVGDFVAQISPWIGGILTTNAMLKDYQVLEVP